MVIAYDGTDYAGWMKQPHQPSLSHALCDAFERVFKKHIQLLGASKTDAGVHAMGQVAVFKTDLALDADKMKWAWNNALPESITIRSLIEDNQFHPHVSVQDKIYYYHLFVDRPLPFCARYGVEVYGAIDWKFFEQALKLFEGTHNFNAFYTGDDRSDPIRTISSMYLEPLKRYTVYRVVIVGERFMRHMVRRMVGAALAVTTRDSVTIEVIQNALQSGKINCELPTAPAKGLMLYKIRYKK